MDIRTLVKLTSRAWSLEILAQIYAGVPGRQAPLLAASGAGRTAFAQSLVHLIELGLLERNPGHGHPLRPEFRLTRTGEQAAAFADKIRQAAPKQVAGHLLRRAWTIPVLVVSKHPQFFKDIRRTLLPITDRALSQSLKQLQAQRWIRRDVDLTRRPMRPLYQASDIGAEISHAAGLVDR